jgi:hypothetical protein
MNGASKGTSGVVNLGTVITAHQDISGKVNTSTTVNGHALTGNVTVTKSDVGLGNVTNDSQVKRSEMGAASGVATLDSSGKVPSSQLPSYVDDVIEAYYKSADGKFYTTLSSGTYSGAITGETGKIYVDLSTSRTYRWGGSAYAEIKASPGTLDDITDGTTYKRMTTTERTKLSGIETGAQVHKAPTAAEVKSALGTGSGTSKYLREDGTWVTPPNDNTTYSAATTSAAGLMSAADKTKLDGVATGATAVSEATVAGWGFTKNTGTLTSHQTLTNHAKLADTSTVGQVLVSKSGGYEWKTLGSNAYNSTAFTTNTGTITKVGNTTSGAVTVSSANNTASFGSAVTVGSVGGVDLKFTMPSNPNTDTKPTYSYDSSTQTLTLGNFVAA